MKRTFILWMSVILLSSLMVGLVDAGPMITVAEENKTKAEDQQISLPDVHVTIIVRSMAPYSASMDKLIAALTDRLGDRFTWRMVAIADGGGVDTLTGTDSLERASIINCLQDQRRDVLWTFLQCLAGQVRGARWEECAVQTSISLEELVDCHEHNSLEKTLGPLQDQIANLDPRRLPALIINNRLFDGYHQLPVVLRELCAGISEPSVRPEACDQLPQCITQDDCYREGFISLCLNAGTMNAVCQYLVPVDIPMITIVPERNCFSKYSETINLTRRMFPGIQLRELDSESNEAKSLISRYNITILPAYLFGPVVEDAYHFDDFKEVFYRQGDRLLFQPYKVGSNYFHQRPLRKGAIDIFYRVSSDRALETLQFMLESIERFPRLKLRVFPILWTDSNGKLTTSGGQPALEESVRQLFVHDRYPKRFLNYVQLYRSSKRSTYWEEMVLGVGLNPETVKQACRGDLGQRLAASCLTEIQALPIPPSFDIVALIENREISSIAGRDDVLRLYNRVSSTIP